MGEQVNTGRLVRMLTLVVIVCAAAYLYFQVGVLESQLIFVLLALLGVLPFGLGFVAQLLVKARAIPDYVFWIAAIVLTTASWISGRGLHVAVGEWSAFNFILTLVYLAWFFTFGASAARWMRQRRTGHLGPPSEA